LHLCTGFEHANNTTKIFFSPLSTPGVSFCALEGFWELMAGKPASAADPAFEFPGGGGFDTGKNSKETQMSHQAF
jgi:hypothetical protein